MAIDLTSFTTARVALGRTGNSLPTAELLRFQLDHARARDAVYAELDPRELPGPHGLVHSAASDRRTYLRRPDLGRVLSDDSRTQLPRGEYDAAIVMADGLSPLAAHRHAAPLLDALMPLLLAGRKGEMAWRMAPLTVVLQGRVAIGDEIGERLGARLVVMLIGERPGLTAPDSLGIYVTYDPRPGRTEAERNCISNVRPEGLPYTLAAQKLHFLMREARVRKLTGVALKEDESCGAANPGCSRLSAGSSPGAPSVSAVEDTADGTPVARGNASRRIGKDLSP
jgi:ethanolamine ammonia-lyase small subunit